ncbi:MAG: UDP-N-acetylglucosamine pyrophosphorylase [Promethearchaeota archaeon]|nr:MAG: UDP-N-acetylglucosamine pyrophosphorylase [Candidatus Lokiarchaeota archaeon]
MISNNRKLVDALIKKGVNIPNPSAIEIGEEVKLDMISAEGVIIHTGCKIFGEKTLIMSGVELGARSPVTINNCQLGRNVELKGGYFEESTFLDSANMGDGAEVRKGCLLEEKANGAHTVGLKQTILFPFVTLGSIINFCDILMSGGTSRKNHSEVGSSYIHFNYTPNQDKATASLIGDVAHGVMLNNPPIFLGGQGGLVGPAIIGYNTVIAAGVICRNDCIQGNKLLRNREESKEDLNFYPCVYWNIRRKVLNCVQYIANIIALKQWYLFVREKFFRGNELKKKLFEGAVEKIEIILEERLKRFIDLANKMEKSINLYESMMGDQVSKTLLTQKKELFENIKAIENIFNEYISYRGDIEKRDEFLKRIDTNLDYIKAIKKLDKKSSEVGTKWLLSIINEIREKVIQNLPSFV